MGWYLAKVISIENDGSICLKYRKGSSIEVIKLTELKWQPARGIDKWFRPTNDITANFSARRSKPDKVKGIADDIIIISSSPSDHAKALRAIFDSCQDLDLTLKPSKCVSLVNDGKKMSRSASFAVGSRFTINITTGPTRFLGQLQTSSQKSKSCKSGKKYIELFQQKLESLDQVRVRGEYKLWVYKRYLVTSFHFVMAVDPIPDSSIKKMQAAALRKIKQWLNLPRCFTSSALHHQNVINIPALSDLRTKAKLTFLASISTSQDPLIEEILLILSNEEYCKNHRIQPSSVDLRRS